jgi:putative membrane protein
MTRKKHYKTIFIKSTMVTATLLSAMACHENKKPEDTKVVADTQNEYNFETNSKENDAAFLVNAAAININEIELAQLAQQKSSNDDLKGFARMLDTDHQASIKEIKNIANTKSVVIPTSMTDEGKTNFKNLTNLSNVDFDKTYTNLMVKAHQDAIVLFDKESTESKDKAIKTLALATLPKLRQHLDIAITFQEKYNKK